MSPKPVPSKRTVDHRSRPDARTEVAVRLAELLLEAREELATRWLERLVSRVAVEPNAVFPSEELLDHVPLLIEGVAAYIRQSDDGLDAASRMLAKAQELGTLRYRQGFDASQILREYEILGGILFTFVEEHADRICSHSALHECAHDLIHAVRRLADAIDLIRQATGRQFLALASKRVNEREAQLRRFNRLVTHELKNHIAAIRGAAALVGESSLSDNERHRFLEIVQSNSSEFQRVLDNLETLSHLHADTRQQRNVLLPHVVSEAVRQQRELARARGVLVSVAPDLPAVEVHAAAVELVLRNYLSNAIKYADPAKPDRWVEIGARVRAADGSDQIGELVIMVCDNGVGVASTDRERLFDQFYRSEEATSVTGAVGSGLGLSLVRDAVEALGGRAWAEFPTSGTTVFAVALPARRGVDAPAGEGSRVGLDIPA